MIIQGRIPYGADKTLALCVGNVLVLFGILFGQSEIDQVYFPIFLGGQ